MDIEKNVVNQTQQPEPQKEEEKKKNKVLAWWLGLGKWAKVGICAGAAAVLATAIALPIVLTNKDGGTYIMTPEQGGNGYNSEKFELKANFTYTFTVNVIDTAPCNGFGINYYDDEAGLVTFTEWSVTGGGEWNINEDKNSLTPKSSELEKDQKLTIKIKTNRSSKSAQAHIEINGK